MGRQRVLPMQRGLWLCGDQARTALCALLLASLALCSRSASIAAAAGAASPDAKPLTAILITARDGLTDPDFANSIVLVMNNLGPAPVGIIINRPTPVSVSHLFPDLKQLSRLKDRVYFGGPVDVETVWFLVRAVKRPEHAIPTCDGVYLSADRGLLLQLLGREQPMEGLRVFVGHAGWAPGQLQEEISEGAWALKRADANTIFSGKSEHPWPEQAPKPST